MEELVALHQGKCELVTDRRSLDEECDQCPPTLIEGDVGSQSSLLPFTQCQHDFFPPGQPSPIESSGCVEGGGAVCVYANVDVPFAGGDCEKEHGPTLELMLGLSELAKKDEKEMFGSWRAKYTESRVGKVLCVL
jgi:hypothetical protein